ncbi:MAG TPA: DUF1559 domain-containing protein, partial [Urbifossiella sp.]
MALRFQWPLTIAAAIGVLVAGVMAAPVPKDPPKPRFADFDEAVAVEAGARNNQRTSTNNLKRIALAYHNYCWANNDKLVQNITDKDGKPLLSWRVQLLPYLEQRELYQKFKLDEPWDSAANIKLVDKIPTVFESPRVKTKKGYTVYQGFHGNGAIFGSNYSIGNLPDGTSNTIFCLEATRAVPWTKPSDIPFDPKKDLPKFGKAFGDKPLAALCD